MFLYDAGEAAARLVPLSVRCHLAAVSDQAILHTCAQNRTKPPRSNVTVPKGLVVLSDDASTASST